MLVSFNLIHLPFPFHCKLHPLKKPNQNPLLSNSLTHNTKTLLSRLKQSLKPFSLSQNIMAFRYQERVEICKKQEGFLGSYYCATLLAAVGINRYIVRYENRWVQGGARQMTEVLDADEVRPQPPTISCTNFSVSDKVDAYVNYAWWVGKVTRKIEPIRTYCVSLDNGGIEVQVPPSKMRIHLDWEDGRWVLPMNRYGRFLVLDSTFMVLLLLCFIYWIMILSI